MSVDWREIWQQGWSSALKFAGLAIAGTIFGDTLYRLIQMFGDWQWSAFNVLLILRYGLLLLVSYAALVLLAPGIVALFRRRQESYIDERESSIQPRAALAVFVSGKTPEKGKPIDLSRNVAKKAIDRMMENDSPLRHVFLMHSPQSKGHAEKIAQDLGGGKVKFHIAGLDANFNDLQSTRDIVQEVLKQLESDQIKLPRKDLLIDITGGTGLATAGAVLAAIDESWHEEPDRLNLTAIPSDENGDYGEVMTWVDIKLVARQ